MSEAHHSFDPKGRSDRPQSYVEGSGVHLSDYSVEYLKRLVDAVEKFSAAFEAWMKTQVESDHMSS